MPTAGPSLPTAKTIQVDTRGAMILDEESPEVRPYHASESGDPVLRSLPHVPLLPICPPCRMSLRGSPCFVRLTREDARQSRYLLSQLHRARVPHRHRRECLPFSRRCSSLPHAASCLCLSSPRCVGSVPGRYRAGTGGGQHPFLDATVGAFCVLS